MNSAKTAKVIKIIDGTTFHLKQIQSGNTLTVQLHPTPSKQYYYHLLKSLSQTQVIFELIKKNNKIKQQHQKATIFLNGKQLSDLYKQQQNVLPCTQESVYEKDQIIQCYIMSVQCLKLKMYLINQNKSLTFYFSQLKLPKIEHTHPKQVWHKAQQYFKSELLGQFVQIKINGSESYHQQMNVYGQILRLSTGLDLKQKALQEGYADLSKNCEKYLSAHQINKFQKIIDQSKKNKKGLWRQQTKITKGSSQVMEQKYKQWQQWSKNKIKYNQIKNVQQQVKQLTSELKKNNSAKSDPNKCRIMLQTIMTIFQDFVTEKNIIMLEQFIKIVISTFMNLQTSISYNTDNLDFLRYLNKLNIVILFYVIQHQRLGNKNKLISAELQKIIKIVFRCCFIGNQTFHQKVFDKRKESDFEKFQFDPGYLSGISSYSQYSQSEDGQKMSKNNKTQKKIISAQTKIRINSTLLLSHLFKNYPNIVENHWQICVKSNILTKDFLQYVQKLKISIEPTKMTQQQKTHIASLMRTNFGDYSLVLLIFFQQNAKVKINALSCMIHMIGNFQSRKIIDTTEAVYVEKLLNQTKSSFVPKSFIVFSGLRNALYFMLFSLHHELNILIINNTFKALTQLCQQSTLIDKMGFMEGMGLLMSNYINPVLQLPWEIKQLTQLKCLCIAFLGALVNTQKKWQQMENQYLMSSGQKNINLCLLSVFSSKNQQNAQEKTKILNEITKYFKNMAKRYYAAIFYEIKQNISVWNSMSDYYLKNQSIVYTEFVEQVFKCHFDQLSIMKNQSTYPRKNIEAIHRAQLIFGDFLHKFFSSYAQIVTIQNYVGILNILTYIPYHKWSESSFEKPKQFLIHCFESIYTQSTNKSYPPITHLRTNPLVRLGLIKLLGYISFCKQFQIPHYSTPAIKSLLQYSKNFKSPNTVTKITWGISNWSNIQCFKQGLTKKQLKECLDYMIKFSQSEKEKIASNCTRGIGFFLTKLNNDVDLQQCRSAIIKNLSHQIIKVRTNSTKTLRTMIQNNLLWQKDEINQKIQELIPILQQNILKNNYHLQTQTLFLIKQLGNPIKESHMMKIYSHILHDLLSHTTMEYQFSQIKALKKLRKVVLQQMVKYSKYIIENEQTCNDFYQTVQNFLLDSQQQFIRKQNENSKILEKGFEKGEQALNTVFNIRKQKYDQQKQISTEFIARGVQYQANLDDLKLLQSLKSVGQVLRNQQIEQQKWIYLSQMQLQGQKVKLGKI